MGFCAYEFAAKAQNSSVAKMEKFLIREVFAGSGARTLTISRGEDYEGTKCKTWALVVKAPQPRVNGDTN